MAGPETATIATRPLRDALHEGDELAWQAFAHAADAADGLAAHPALVRCAGCRAPWTGTLGPSALVEAWIDGERAVGLLCRDCASGGDVPATLERLLRAMLPEGSRVFDKRVSWTGRAGHA